MSKFFKSYTVKSVLLTAIASGLYPLIHYYSNNLDLVGSSEQHLYLLRVSFLLPASLLIFSWLIFKAKRFLKAKKYLLTAVNLMVFFGLLSVIVFHFEKKVVMGILFLSGIASLFLYRYLHKILILQFLLAVMSLFTLVPKVVFAVNHENNWVSLNDNILATKLKHTPNIYVIQPDGYVNIDQINKPPYSFNNSVFNDWLEKDGFVNYKGFRSNYYSTLTSNSSMFAMKHHYYSNTFKGNLKTFHANHVIVGKENNVLKVLTNNNYTSYLLTDNSHFLIDRVPLQFDFYNVPDNKILTYDSGYIHGFDIVFALENTLKTVKENTNNFFFIESTIPSHIAYNKASSLGIEEEKEAYITRLKDTNIWLQNLINTINAFDDNPMIVIIADHGGFVGLNYTLEALEKRLTEEEMISAFSSMLSIKWPKDVKGNRVDFKTNVNVFRNIFSALAEDTSLLRFKETNSTFIPLKEKGEVTYYQCIDEDDNVVYKIINND